MLKVTGLGISWRGVSYNQNITRKHSVQKHWVARAREVCAFILNWMKPDFRRMTLTWLVPRFTGSQEMCCGGERTSKWATGELPPSRPALVCLLSTDCFRRDTLSTATFLCHQELSRKVVSFLQISAVFHLPGHREYCSVVHWVSVW